MVIRSGSLFALLAPHYGTQICVATTSSSVAFIFSILQLSDMHIVLSFENEGRSGRIPDIFLDCYKVRETGPELRNNRTLDIPWAGTNLWLSRSDIKGARLWEMYFETVNPLIHKRSFRKRITKYFVSKYILLISPHCPHLSSFIISQPLWIHVLNQCRSIPFTRGILHIAISLQNV